ncbi:hypothetical protein CLAFUW4_06675 [Fulvia fulva]|uniref:Spindle pole body-associated protein cut12 domain-containing protein n=1 Tax=Passalora fulva TaxID=5499 RepID=A0A9Q8PBM0_PASFU|nr:uncharacterized protein CLAFUR5_06818 [Fulvia fulva]KAK4621652.1 hypothetical protein CLAFUR4_06683 [Fulvia fulva]KAK4622993.1 hypothetical protein CLAFUR0_06677 [Fulvia fulva]UJO19491.1 hypothetical protein CLAFUR5_06818 [Fulvia fulva]WPV16043.1 hypothetical protein CLAFUW4_06675 [Fulvia fulva]WPV31663.1 hypothetical protein CLAFUW7_06674 [Fulvia fulva]
MLHWLAGQKPHDGNADPDATGFIEPPETPAPVFAVRAFKHAIFGTPGTVQKPPRRHSEDETARRKHNARPGMLRPKSATETATLNRYEPAIEDEPLPSPTKGILLTPGTAAARRKTVSFGDNVVDNENKKPMKSVSGLPDDCPGKFPSPWSKSVIEQDTTEQSAEKLGGRSKLTEQLQQVRDESARRKAKSSRQARDRDEQDETLDLAEPVSQSGKYWQQEYNIYRERTTKEVRKLVEKTKSSRDYARKVDDENLQLKEDLRQETSKVAKLEERVLELEAQLKDLHAKMQDRGTVRPSVKDESRPARGISGLLSDNRKIVAPKPGEASDEQAEKADSHRLSWKSGLAQRSRDRAQSSTTTAAHEEKFEEAKPADQKPSNKLRSRPRDIKVNPRDDIWAPSSGLGPPPPEPSPPSPRASRAVTSGTDATCLKSLSINTLPRDDSRALAMSMGLQPPSPEREKRQDTPMRSPGLPQPSPDQPGKASTRPQPEPAKLSYENDASIRVPDKSSLFNPDTILERPNVLTGTPVPLKPLPARPTLQTRRSPDAKENVAPSRRPAAHNMENDKPTAAWNNLDNSKRITSRDGKEIPADKLAAARERLLAKGRNIS